MYLKQLELEGYSIFVVLGQLPECAADSVLRAHPLDPSMYNTTDRRGRRKSKEKKEEKVVVVETESLEDIRRRRLARFCGGPPVQVTWIYQGRGR